MSYGTPPPPPPPQYGASFPGASPGGTGQSIPALLSLILGVLGIVNAFCCSFLPLFQIAAIVLGLIGMNDVKGSGGGKTGHGMALSGLILGGVGILIAIASVVLAVVLNVSNPATPNF